MPSDVALADFKRWFAKYGLEFIGGGKHPIKMRGPIRGDNDGAFATYPVPTRGGRFVKYLYVREGRKRFGLTPENGVSDEDFFR